MAKKKAPAPQTSTDGSGALSGASRRRAKSVAEANDRSLSTGTSVTTSEEVLAASRTESDVLASPSGVVSSPSPSYDEIAQAAYQRYLERGGEHGRDFEDWVEAERQLSSRRNG